MSILRNEVSKVVSEVKAISVAQCRTQFLMNVQLCANHTEIRSNGLDILAASDNARIAAEQANRVRPRLGLIRASRINLPHEIYIPANGDNDNAIISTSYHIRELLCADRYKQEIRSGRGHNSLNSLNDGGKLFIIGHGNFGKGIGTRIVYGAMALIQQLIRDGLEPSPAQPVVIYLFSCWTATHTRKGIVGVVKENRIYVALPEC
ncbi:hypothetical protein L2734_05020 [Parashewanella spongiae]|uniref:hypothetical protein n=1 Tax=Parashewanella spongiae TaxID=342950 RepID=UPI0010592669|nr:hypothetical protein [Parashewanella spongiae]MCL1077542.1 hypothetical protein [Parashewanella spongiae]